MSFRGFFWHIHGFKKILIPFSLVLAGCLVLCLSRGALGFITLEHEGWNDLNTLIKKVHEDHWTIHYSYGDNCPAEERDNDAALTAAITDKSGLAGNLFGLYWIAVGGFSTVFQCHLCRT